MISLRAVTAKRGEFSIRGITFDVPDAGYGMVVGPAGSGKTTTLETIAGLITPATGQVILDGEDVTGRAPEGRNLAIVYQHAYLFPHLDVRANIEYGANDSSWVAELVDRFGLRELQRRSVNRLSGGERQLVAIVRALASEPRILLLDEPFAALDPHTRAATRRMLKVVHAERKITTLHVTHDFAEAGSLGDVVMLMDAGRVAQSGLPAEVFRKPATRHAASFLGAENILAGVARPIRDRSPDWSAAAETQFEEHAVALDVGGLTIYAIGDALPGPINAVIRAEEIAIDLEAGTSSIRNQFPGHVTEVLPAGAVSRVSVDVNGTPFVAALTSRSVGELGIVPGKNVFIAFKATAVHLC